MGLTDNLFIVVVVYPDGREAQADPHGLRVINEADSCAGANSVYAVNKADAIAAADKMVTDEAYRAVGVKILGRSNTPRHALNQWQYLVDRSTGVVTKPKRAPDKTPLLPMTDLAMPAKSRVNASR